MSVMPISVTSLSVEAGAASESDTILPPQLEMRAASAQDLTTRPQPADPVLASREATRADASALA